MATWSKEVFAKNLKEQIERKGKTQKEIAEIVGVSAPTLNEWVKGKKYPRIDKIEILANYFGILKSDLIEDKTKERKEMQKKNDTITDAVVRMRQDAEFLSLVEKMLKYDSSKISNLRDFLSAFVE